MLYVATKIIGKANAVKSVSNLPIPSNPKIKLPLFIYFRVYDALFKAKYFASSLKYKLANEIHKVRIEANNTQDFTLLLSLNKKHTKPANKGNHTSNSGNVIQTSCGFISC